MLTIFNETFRSLESLANNSTTSCRKYDITPLFTCAMTELSMLLNSNIGDKKIWQLINWLKNALTSGESRPRDKGEDRTQKNKVK